MHLETQKDRGVFIIRIPLETLDAENTAGFRKAVSPLLDGEERVLLDLSTVQFIDSSGCGALISCLRQVKSQKGVLKVAGLQKPVRVILELVHMQNMLEMFDGPEKALESFL